ncbi:MAG: M48 family metalloprotease [Balneolaceae bacterium]|nr:M48 family metalloprotease [Balneolaceae bacterium]
MKKYLFTIPFVIAIALFISSCVVQESPVTGNQRAYAYSWSQEVQIGQEVDREIIAEFGLYDDDDVLQYVVDLSEEVLSVSHMRREDTSERFRETEFTFRVLDSPVVNAFALPGGYIYVTRGLLAHLNNDAQLAMVQGHEIGHVAARHASQRGLQQTIGQVAVIGGAILGQELLGLPGESILNLSGQAAQLIFLSYSRNHERESDRLGVEYAAMAGFEAAEGAAFFTSLRRLSERSGQSIPNMLSSHPNPGEREKNIPRMAQEWADRGYEQTRKNTEQYMQMIDGITYGEDPRQGFVDGERFVHPELKFQYPVPSGWQVINQPSQVVYVGHEGQSVMILRIDSQSSTAKASVENFIGQEGFELIDQQEAVSSEGLTAYEANFTVSDEQGNLGVNIYAVEYDGRIYRFINYTQQNRFSDTLETFRNVTGAFDELTEERILNINPVRLQIIQVEERIRFSDLLPSELPMNIEADEVAIINQVDLDDMIEPGRYIKIPVQ